MVSYFNETGIFNEFSASGVESDVAPIQLKAFIYVLVFSFVTLKYNLSTVQLFHNYAFTKTYFVYQIPEVEFLLSL